MLKKGQLTAFIIIGILVFAAAGAFAYFTAYKGKEQVPASMQQIKLFTDDCLKQTLENAVFLSGVQGGVIYFEDVLPNQETFYSYSTYWYDNGVDTSVSREFIENEINTYIEEEIELQCIRDYEAFHDKIAVGELSSETKIKDDSIEVTMDYPVTLMQGDTRTMISRFSAELPVRYSEAINIANEIVREEIRDPDTVHLSQNNGKELSVISYMYSDDVMLYSIIDNDNPVKGMGFRLMFANRFGDETSGDNRAPALINANNLLFVEGIEAEYRFNAIDEDNDNLKFDSIGEFDVSDDGVLKLKPTARDVGEHSLTVVVKDNKGGRDAETIKILVIGA